MNREDQMAPLVADGMTVAKAGEQLGPTKGQTSLVWQNIKSAMGRQAI